MDVREKAVRCSIRLGSAQSIYPVLAPLTLAVWLSANTYSVDLDLIWFIVYMSFCCGTTFMAGLLAVAAATTLNRSLIKFSGIVNGLNCFATLFVYSSVELMFCIKQHLPLPLLLIPGVLLIIVTLTQIFLFKAVVRLLERPSSSQGTREAQRRQRITNTVTRSAAGTHIQLESGTYVVSTRNPDYPVDMAAAPPPYPGYVDLAPPDYRAVTAAKPPSYSGYTTAGAHDYPCSMDAASLVHPERSSYV